MKTLRWGILSTGRIAGVFADGLSTSKTGKLVAVASRTQSAADKFGERYNVKRCYGSYQALLDDPEVDAVYVAPPHPYHAEWAIKTAEAGKHILCEKPIGMNHAEAMAIVEAARRHDVFLMEAFMYRCHPQTAKLAELVRNKTIGEVRVIQATFSFHSPWNPQSRVYSNALGGGGILDVGCYCVSMSRLLAGVATGHDFAEPLEVKGAAHLGKTGVDEWAIGTLKFPGDILAQVATGVAVGQESVVRIFGSEGWIFVPEPWFGSRKAGASELIVYRHDAKKPRRVLVKSSHDLYTIEADTVAAHIENRQASPPAMTWDDTLGNMKTLDAWRAEVGLVYNAEKVGARIPTANHRPLKVRPDNRMKYGRIAGVDKPVSRLALGAMFEEACIPNPHLHVMFDEFFARGGNLFDTAYVYYGGLSDKILGQWIKNRGVRKEIVILGKGAHTPFCDPEHVTQQLLESLDRLQTDYLDIYMMHRDNLEVPVGEFIEVLNEHKRKGRIRAFGGSNWSLARVEAANRYAKRKGLAGFSAVSNNFSLARMVDPVWPGCIAASDAKSRAWFKKHQLALVSWSSQARGFFVRANRKDRVSDPELVRCWYSTDNFRRLDRAKQMARKRRVTPNNIALAYVLNQPFPTFALIGPRSLEEMRTSWPALEIELTPNELRWLNLEA